MSNLFAYRPSVAALIFDQKARFLLTQLIDARNNEFDFVKGGMHDGESKEQTLKREIEEELGEGFKYQIIEQSHWYIVYDWPRELQEKKGYMGQARTSFWVKYFEGDISLNNNELINYRWVEEHDLKDVLLESGFPDVLVSNLLNEWEMKKELLLSSKTI